jgi:diguanylate cyclase (GGDEF)-like protein
MVRGELGVTMRAVVIGGSTTGRLVRVEIAMTAVAAVLLATGPLRGVPQTDSSLALALVVLGVAFFAVEAMPLHLEWSGQAYSLTLSELPLVVGLLVLPSPWLIPARIIGGGAALIWHRRQPTHKFLFNVAMQFLEATIAYRLFLAVPGHGDRPVMRAAPAVLIAVGVSTACAMAATCVAIRISVGSLNRRVVRSCAIGCLTSTIVNPAIALVAMSAWRDSRLTLPSTLLVLAAVGIVYRAYVSLHQRHSGLETLYEFTRSIGRNGSTEDQIRLVLAKTCELLRSEGAGILLDLEAGRPSLRWIDRDGHMHVEHALHPQVDWPFAMVMSSNSAVVLPRSSRSTAERAFLEHRGMRDAILAPLLLDGEARGVLFVRDRRGDVATFTEDDGRLFETIAAHVANVLDNSRLVDQLRHESRHDALTGLQNRQSFRSQLSGAIARGGGWALLLADLDRFKEINDTLGHHYGDLLIREVATRITAAAPARSLIARLGGDEFAVLTSAETLDEALAIGRTVRAAISAPCVVDGVAIDVDASIGVALAAASGPDETVLLKRADMAMYAAKSAGTGVEAYNPERDEYSPRRLALASELRTAIERDQLLLNYQPQVTAEGAMVGVEALVRWLHPEYGLVMPDEFIHLAEQSGAIVQLTAWVLRKALDQVAAWHENGINVSVSVNVSMRNLLDANIVDLVRGELRQRNLAPERLTLEITESHIMSDVGRTLPILHRLASLGVRLSIDDFGTGYSSLAYLQQFPVHEIKIDKSFVTAIEAKGSDSIAAAIISIANSLHVDAVAEGVETEAVATQLRTMGCTRLQGYYVAPPLHAGQVPTMVLSENTIRLPLQRTLAS